MDINSILRRDPVSSKYGPPMGASSFFNSVTPLFIQRIRFVDGDYSADGTYWGNGGEPLWCAFNGEDGFDAPAMGTRIFVRAHSRKLAIEQVQELFPTAHFKRG